MDQILIIQRKKKSLGVVSSSYNGGGGAGGEIEIGAMMIHVWMSEHVARK
jgi:hypothetical protein